MQNFFTTASRLPKAAYVLANHVLFAVQRAWLSGDFGASQPHFIGILAGALPRHASS
jgi:hypothetical protein